jgi:hypothetical protein
MYLGGDRLYYFAGENVVQKFLYNNSFIKFLAFLNNKETKIILKQHTLEVCLVTQLLKVIEYTRPEMRETVKSVYFENKGKDAFGNTVGKTEDRRKPKEPPRDLGEKFVKILLVQIAFRIEHNLL